MYGGQFDLNGGPEIKFARLDVHFWAYRFNSVSLIFKYIYVVFNLYRQIDGAGENRSSKEAYGGCPSSPGAEDKGCWTNNSEQSAGRERRSQDYLISFITMLLSWKLKKMYVLMGISTFALLSFLVFCALYHVKCNVMCTSVCFKQSTLVIYNVCI